MKIKTLIAAAAVSMAGQSFAFDVWNGSKTLASFDWKGILAYQVELNDRHGTATVADYNGVGYGSFKEVDDKLVINLRSPISMVGYPTVFNPHTQVMEQIYTESKVNEMTLTQVAEGIYAIDIETENCHTFRVPGEQDRIECSKETKELPETYEKLDQPRKMQTKVEVGEKIILPLANYDVSYVEILEGNKVKDFNASDINPVMKTLVQNDGSITAGFEDGTKIVYTRLAESNGYELLIGEKLDETGQIASITQGIIVKDENVRTAALDLTGSYNSTGFGSGMSFSDEFIFNFNADGFGGFTSYNASTDSNSEIVWNWNQNATGMEATRWMLSDRSSGFLSSKEEIKQCIDKVLDCYPVQKRDYRVVAKDGNKIVVLRTMKMNLNFQHSDDYNTNYALQILYKK